MLPFILYWLIWFQAPGLSLRETRKEPRGKLRTWPVYLYKEKATSESVARGCYLHVGEITGSHKAHSYIGWQNS